MTDAAPFGRYERLRPDDLSALVEQTPVAYWPLGLLEHHGWHLPVGFDGLKADGLCERLAQRVGGVILPTMWWGGGGGHDVFRWTHYQPESAYADILTTTADQLFEHGFRAIVLLAGHYPWQQTLNRVVPDLRTSHPEGLILAGSELTVAGDIGLKGDHAALEETSYGLALFPDLIDMKAMTSDRGGSSIWPKDGPPDPAKRHPGVEYDPAEPLFAQMGEDSRMASGARGADAANTLLNELERLLRQYLNT
ncbi:MAG: creatininase family protein [Gemmatimonadetes bacterium]|nr:creatininase family protein [Gemmatimonadota bacterium]MBT7860737.1 creatininase family protein [Gemmatimonadota bacterium]